MISKQAEWLGTAYKDACMLQGSATQQFVK